MSSRHDVATLRSPQVIGIHTQLNHDGSTIDPVAVEILYHRPRVLAGAASPTTTRGQDSQASGGSWPGITTTPRPKSIGPSEIMGHGNDRVLLA